MPDKPRQIAVIWAQSENVVALTAFLDALSASILHPERRTVFRLALASVVEPGRGDVRMAEPFLHLGDVRFMRERIGRGRHAQRVHAESVNLGVDAGCASVLDGDIALDRARNEVKYAREHPGCMCRYGCS
jgi:hypothetical protein